MKEVAAWYNVSLLGLLINFWVKCCELLLLIVLELKYKLANNIIESQWHKLTTNCSQKKKCFQKMQHLVILFLSSELYHLLSFSFSLYIFWSASLNKEYWFYTTKLSWYLLSEFVTCRVWLTTGRVPPKIAGCPRGLSHLMKTHLATSRRLSC